MEHSEYREFFSTLANLSRLAIVQMLRRRGATVTQIAETLGYEQSRVSHSLARLQRAGIVACRWEDKRKMFHLVEDVSPLLRDIEVYLERHPKAARHGVERNWNGNWAAAASD
ncbi:MAG TPA: winged helix-turn-helix domain-containing protein [Terriglobales bacterium]|nr:winged helix-turn-helix domain-containing protein [Terriglobales bacterium]